MATRTLQFFALPTELAAMFNRLLDEIGQEAIVAESEDSDRLKFKTAFDAADLIGPKAYPVAFIGRQADVRGVEHEAELHAAKMGLTTIVVPKLRGDVLTATQIGAKIGLASVADEILETRCVIPLFEKMIRRLKKNLSKPVYAYREDTLLT